MTIEGSPAPAPAEGSPEAAAVAAQVAAGGTPPAEGTPAPSPAPGPSSWNYADDIPGVGDKPDWFNSEKYSTVQAQAEAHTALASRFGDFKGAPEKYDLNISKELTEAGIVIPDDDLMLEEFKTLAKDMQLDQAGFDKMSNLYGEIRLAEAKADIEARQSEMESLGPTAQTRIDTLMKWGTANMSSEMYQDYEMMVQSAGSIAVLERIISRSGQGSIAPEHVTPKASITKDELKEMQFAKDEHGQRKMANPAYAAEFHRKMEELYPGEHNVTIGG